MQNETWETSYLLDSWLFSILPITKLWLAFNIISVTISSVLWNYILIEKNLIPRNTHLPAMFFILFCGLFEMSSGNVMLIGLIPFLLCMKYLFDLDNEQKKTNTLFFTGFFLGIACLFLPNLIYLYILILGILIVNQYNKLNYYLLFTIALLLPVYFLWTGFFVLAEGEIVFKTFLASVVFTLPSILNFSVVKWVEIATFCIFVLVGMLGMLSLDVWRINKIRRWYNNLLLFFLFLFAIVTINGFFSPYLIVLLIPSSLFASAIFIPNSKGFFKNLLFYILVVSVVFVKVIHLTKLI